MDADLARIESKIDALHVTMVQFMLRTENRVTKLETKTLIAGGVVASVVSGVIGIVLHGLMK